MNESQAKALPALSDLADKAALELVFAQPGSDSGLLPVNSFISEMEELCAELPAPLQEAIAKGRALIDDVFLSTGQFTRESLDQLHAWLPWLQSVIAAVGSGKTAPIFAISESSIQSTESTGPSSAETGGEEKPLLLNLSDRELLQEFVNESREHLQNIESGVLVLEDNPTDADTLNSIFRAFHTFKGGSGFLNLTPINKLAHELESLLDLARGQKIQITCPVIEIILRGGDTLKQFIDAIDSQVTGRSPEAPILIPTAPLREQITCALQHSDQSSQTTESAFVPQVVPAFAGNSPALSSAVSSNSIKVDTDKLDTLIDMVGEMIIAQSLVAQDAVALGDARFTRNLGHLARATKELQRTAMSLRMVPISGTFQKMNRLVRDVSQACGKQIDLHIQGEEAELDRNIVDAIADPLIHMIRNSIDHGIEKSEARAAANKPAVGQITLSAFHQGGSFLIQIKDDGAGLNRAKILKKAAAQGLLPEDLQLSDKEIFNLIFTPGFSTADTVTDISGRGVGMDVVRRNIDKLRGKIEIESVEGQGATFTIHLPLTLAIIDGLIVRVGEDRYIIPTLSVCQSFRPTPEMLSTALGRGELVTVRGRHLPLLRLNQYLNGTVEQTDPTQAVVVVVECDGAQRSLLVDELLGKQEVVIKSLGDTFHNNPLLAGAAILADGRVGLILDVNTLVHLKQNTLSKAA